MSDHLKPAHQAELFGKATFIIRERMKVSAHVRPGPPFEEWIELDARS